MKKDRKFIYSGSHVPGELHPLLDTLAEEYGASEGSEGIELEFEPLPGEGSRVSVVRRGNVWRIGYTSLSSAARGIGAALAGLECEEESAFTSLGIMLDLSRNMVMTVTSLKRWFRKLALAGYNTVMLYCEDTYELEGEPVFGYMRGRYTLDEIRELDAFAARLGIELTGCIETLGHLEQILQWSQYKKVRDTASVLLADQPETYALIGKMLDFWSRALSTRRIHIGMDETHDLGRGVFLDRHGYERGFDIFNRHLNQVNSLCRERGLEPMIWSDMYFRLSNPARAYYDYTSPIPDDVRDAIPRNVQLVYWDYYHADAESYSAMIRRHRELGFEPMMASGIWTWPTLWYDHAKTAETVPPCIEACRQNQIKELIFTMWGDDGAFCDMNSALAGVYYASDLAWGGKGEACTAARFNSVCAPADYKAYLSASKMNALQTGTGGREMKIFSSYLIWDDPLQGIAFAGYRRSNPCFDSELCEELEKIRSELDCAILENRDPDLLHAHSIVMLLARKLRFHAALNNAYDRKDHNALREIAEKTIPELVAAAADFDRSFREQWMRNAKPFGLERIQARNAALIARMEETARRINEFLCGNVPCIEELECRLPPEIPANEHYARYALVSAGTNII